MKHTRLSEVLFESEQRFRAAFDESAVGMALIAPDGGVQQINQKYCDILGYSSGELIERGLQDITHSNDREVESEYMRRALAGEIDSYLMDKRYRKKDGPLFWVSVATKVIFDPSGQHGYFISVVQDISAFQDITERKMLEEQLVQAQKMEAVGRLAGGVAHDLSSLLMVITWYCGMILKRLPDQDPIRHDIGEIKMAGERAAALIAKLLAFSRQQVLDVTVIDLNTVVTSGLQMLKRLIGEDIDLHTMLDSVPQWVKADRGQLDQVVMNLVVNGRDAMPGGGRLDIETSTVAVDERVNGQFGETPSGAYVMLAVRDSGKGMDDETKAHLFEPFYTTKARGKGTGLGLATVHGIVRQSGGHILVESAPGRGASFKILLPLADTTAEEATLEQAPRGTSTGGETILLVEDDDQVRDVARQMLEMNGYVVLQSDAEDAVEDCRLYPGTIHLLLSDLVMPKLNGRELAEQLAIVRPEMKVLFMSGYTDNVILDRGIHTRGIALLDKPFTFETLQEKVRSVLDN